MSAAAEDSPKVNRAVLQVLARELTVCPDKNPGPATTDAEALALAAAVVDACNGTLAPQAKVRQMLFTLRTNPSLKRDVLTGTLSPAQLVAMPNELLATEEVRRRDRKAAVIAQRANTFSGDALEIQRTKKSGGSKTEWFGGDEDEILPRKGPRIEQLSDGAGTARMAPKRAADADLGAVVKGALTVDTINGVYVSKRLRAEEEVDVSAASQVERLTAVRTRAVRQRHGTKSSRSHKEEAAAVARLALNSALGGVNKISREAYKASLRAIVHKLLECTAGSREEAQSVWDDSVVQQCVSAHLAEIGFHA